MVKTTLPTDSTERKNYALFKGCLNYFPAALAGIAKTSKLGNDKHNPGQELHHARNKSQDHGDCVLRHLMDVSDLLAARDRGEVVDEEFILSEVSSMAWRALALSQEIHEKLGSPLAPGARVEAKVPEKAGDLHAAAEKAHEDISEMIKARKAKYAKKFAKGDVVQHISNDVEVTVEGTYYDEQGNPILFVKDADEKVFGVDPNFYKSIYKKVE